MKVTCDECGKRFTARPTESPTPDGGLIMQFTCPKCEHVYPVATITARGVKLRAELAEALKRGDHAEAERLRRKFQRETKRG